LLEWTSAASMDELKAVDLVGWSADELVSVKVVRLAASWAL
jgi:hypothetical protein